MVACSPTEPTTPTEPPTSTLRGAVVPTRIPTDTPTPTDIPTDTPTPSATPTETLTPLPTDTPTDTPTSTESPTETPLPTETPIPTIDPTQVSGSIDMAANLASLRQYERAIEAYTSVLALDEDNIVALLGRASVYQELENNDLARLDYERVFELDTENTVALYELGAIADERGDLRTSIEFMTAVIAIEPENSRALAYRGAVRVDLGEVDEAIEDFSRALDADPGNTFALISRGYAYSFNEAYQEAYDDITAYIQVTGDGDNEEVLGVLSELEDRLGIGSPVEIITGASGERLVQTGRITATDAGIEFELIVEAGERINILMNATSGNLDPFLILQTADGTLLQENDDDPLDSTFNAAIRDFVVPEEGTYTIVATRFQEELGTTTGDFELIIEFIEGDVIADEEEGTSVILSETGNITATVSALSFEFMAQAGDRLNIFMNATSGNLDPYLFLLNDLGDLITENDDDPLGSTFNAAIRDIELTADGTYVIVATRFQGADGTSTGAFELIVERQGESEAIEFTPDGALIVYGELVRGSITNDAPSVSYRFEAAVGDVIGIQMNRITGSLDTLVELYNEAGNLIAENDDDLLGTGRDSYLRDYRITQTGIYTIRATRYQAESGTTIGNFELEVFLMADRD